MWHLTTLRKYLDRKPIRDLYCSLIMPGLIYWVFCKTKRSQTKVRQLKALYGKLIRVVYDCKKRNKGAPSEKNALHTQFRAWQYLHATDKMGGFANGIVTQSCLIHLFALPFLFGLKLFMNDSNGGQWVCRKWTMSNYLTDQSGANCQQQQFNSIVIHFRPNFGES